MLPLRLSEGLQSKPLGGSNPPCPGSTSVCDRAGSPAVRGTGVDPRALDPGKARNKLRMCVWCLPDTKGQGTELFPDYIVRIHWRLVGGRKVQL